MWPAQILHKCLIRCKHLKTKRFSHENPDFCLLLKIGQPWAHLPDGTTGWPWGVPSCKLGACSPVHPAPHLAGPFARPARPPGLCSLRTQAGVGGTRADPASGSVRLYSSLQGLRADRREESGTGGEGRDMALG